MVNVLLIGGTGFIGKGVAASLRRYSHRVFTLARTDEKANLAEQAEQVPVRASYEEPEKILKAIEQYDINVVVDLAGAHSITPLLDVVKKASAARQEKAQESGILHPPKIGYVYISGVWVHGSSGSDHVNDLSLLDTKERPARRFVAWRPAVERQVINSRDALNVAVVRPGIVYGGASAIVAGYTGDVIDAHKAGKTEVDLFGDASALIPTVHLDDAADGIRLVVEKIELISGVNPVFDLVTYRESLPSIYAGVARTVGYKGKLNLLGDDESKLLYSAFVTSARTDSSRAKSLLGWQPLRASFVDEVEIYTRAWIAGGNTQYIEYARQS